MRSNRLLTLDKRLSAVAGLFPVCEYGVDIGADHGKLSAWLLQTERCERMIVSDISPLSVQKVGQLMEEMDLSQRCIVREADGFAAIDRPVDAVAVCGLGGKTIADMVKQQPKLPGNPALILSAHTQIPLLRRTLVEQGYQIEKEVIVSAARRFYNIIKAVVGTSDYSDKQIHTGFHVEGSSQDELYAYYQWRYNVEKSKQTGQGQILAWLKEEMEQCGRL